MRVLASSTAVYTLAESSVRHRNCAVCVCERGGKECHVSGVNFESYGMTAKEGKEKKRTENEIVI